MQLAGEAIPSQPFVTASVPVSLASPAGLRFSRSTRSFAVTARWSRSSRAKISVAMTKAFLAVSGGQGAASARIRELVAQLTDGVVRALIRRQPAGGTFHIEDVQDQVELALMRSGEHDTARAYVLYRERARSGARTRSRRKEGHISSAGASRRGARRSAPARHLAARRSSSSPPAQGWASAVQPQLILQDTLKNLYDGVPMDEVRKSAILSARALIEKDPGYSYVTARLLLNTIRLEVLGEEVSQADMASRYADYFPQFVEAGDRGGAARRTARALRSAEARRRARRRRAT